MDVLSCGYNGLQLSYGHFGILTSQRINQMEMKSFSVKCSFTKLKLISLKSVGLAPVIKGL